MNRSAGRPAAGVGVAYSPARGPVALNSMSMRPASCATGRRYASTAGSSRASMTPGRARPPAAAICLAAALRPSSPRPAKNTSAPSAANALATAGPIGPPAPQLRPRTQARQPKARQHGAAEVGQRADPPARQRQDQQAGGPAGLTAGAMG